MVQLWCVIGLILSTICVSFFGAAFSIFGLGKLFSGAVLAISLMAAALELSKFFIAAFLHQSWPKLNALFKSYLLSAVVILSVITSMGIFGFLSDAYQESSTTLEAENIKLESLKGDQQRNAQEFARLSKAIDEIPDKRITRKMKTRAELEPALLAISKDNDRIAKAISQANLTILEVKRKVGPLIYIARALDMNIDIVVKYLILLIVSVFDPLAICLVIAVSESLRLRKIAKAQTVASATAKTLKMQFAKEEKREAG